MKILIRGEKIKITKAMEEYAKEKLSKLDKYLKESDDVTAHVLFKNRNYKDKVEITIPLPRFVLRAEEEQETFYAAIDVVIDKLERQIRKNKDKLNTKEQKVIRDFEIPVTEEPVKERKIVKRKELDLKPMSEEEAILQMELLHHEFFIFKDQDTNFVSVVYKRKDGNYGIIETE